MTGLLVGLAVGAITGWTLRGSGQERLERALTTPSRTELLLELNTDLADAADIRAEHGVGGAL